MSRQTRWLGRAVFGTFRGLEALGDGVLSPVKKQVQCFEFRASREKPFFVPEEDEVAVFRRVVRRDDQTDVEIVGCVRGSQDYVGRPGFIGCCVALGLSDGAYKDALEYCYEVVTQAKSMQPETIGAFADCVSLDNEMDQIRKTNSASLHLVQGRSTTFCISDIDCYKEDALGTITLLLSIFCLSENYKHNNLYVYSKPRKRETSLDVAVLNDYLFEMKSEIDKLRESERKINELERERNELERERNELRSRLSSAEPHKPVVRSHGACSPRTGRDDDFDCNQVSIMFFLVVSVLLGIAGLAGIIPADL